MPTWPLQQAVFAALGTDAQLTALIGPGRVLDDVPQATPLPYVTLGRMVAQDWSTGSESGTEHAFTVHVWSDAKGKKQTHEILAAIRAALHDQPLSVVGHSLVNLRQEHSEIRRDTDGETIHATARFRAVTEP
jgi:Protein of unknown function (DUF3168)